MASIIEFTIIHVLTDKAAKHLEERSLIRECPHANEHTNVTTLEKPVYHLCDPLKYDERDLGEMIVKAHREVGDS